MPGVIDLVIIQILHQVGIINPNRGELLVLAGLFSFSFQRSADIFRADGQFTQGAFGYVLFKLAVRNRLHFRGKKVLLQVGK